MNPLNRRERSILDGLSSYIEEKGYPPSRRELAGLVGLKSPNTIGYHLERLEKKGFVKRLRNRSRALEVVQKPVSRTPGIFMEPARPARIPILGTIPAGAPNLMIEENDEILEVDHDLAQGASFALRVKGDSMQDAGILEGDLVVVRTQCTAREGDIVVARFEDEATVKFFKRLKGRVHLVPANPKYRPIPADHALIMGKVTGVLRKY